MRGGSGGGGGGDLVRDVALSADHSLASVAGPHGVWLFHVSPPQLLAHLNVRTVGEIQRTAVLGRSNILWLVPAEGNNFYSTNSVLLWDFKRGRIVMDVAFPGQHVLSVLVSSSRLVVLQQQRLHVFTMPGHEKSRLLRSEEMRSNPLGLAALAVEEPSSAGSPHFLAVPGFKSGTVNLMNLHNLTPSSSLAPYTIEAHLGDVTQIVLSNDGSLLATGSKKGTLIRVFDTHTKARLLECRRGADPSTLHCVHFSPCNSFLAVSSDKGTVHLFALRDHPSNDGGLSSGGSSGSLSRKTGSTFLRQVMGAERRSFAQCSVGPRTRTLCFPPQKSGAVRQLVALCVDGTYHSWSLAPDVPLVRSAYELLPELALEHTFWTDAL